MPPPIEPTLAAFPNPVLRYVAATRPPFLSVTFAACLIGLATAALDGVALRPLAAFITVFFALVAHAGINVLNDYYDALNGTDAANTERQFPFTGGSRFIHNGVLGMHAAGVFGYGLLAAVVPAGLWLAWSSANGLILIGLAGLFVGWAYSAPPLKFMARVLRYDGLLPNVLDAEKNHQPLTPTAVAEMAAFIRQEKPNESSNPTQLAINSRSANKLTMLAAPTMTNGAA